MDSGKMRVIYDVRRTHPFGGMKRYAIGWSIQTGSSGSEWNDPRENRSFTFTLEAIVWIFSICLCWKAKAR